MNRHKRLLMRCRICGREYQARFADLCRGRGLLCSRSCAGKRSRLRPQSQTQPLDSERPAAASHPLPASLKPRTDGQEP